MLSRSPIAEQRIQLGTQLQRRREVVVSGGLAGLKELELELRVKQHGGRGREGGALVGARLEEW